MRGTLRDVAFVLADEQTADLLCIRVDVCSSLLGAGQQVQHGDWGRSGILGFTVGVPGRFKVYVKSPQDFQRVAYALERLGGQTRTGLDVLLHLTPAVLFLEQVHHMYRQHVEVALPLTAQGTDLAPASPVVGVLRDLVDVLGQLGRVAWLVSADLANGEILYA